MISGGSPTLQLGPLSHAVTSFLREATLRLGWGLSSFQTSSVFVHTGMCERVIYVLFFFFFSKMGTRKLLEMTDPRNIAGNSLVPFGEPVWYLQDFPHVISPSPQEDCQGQFLTSLWYFL